MQCNEGVDIAAFVPPYAAKQNPETTWALALMYRVRLFNVGLHFLAAKVVFSCLSVYRFGKKFWELLTLGQVKRVQNFC